MLGDPNSYMPWMENPALALRRVLVSLSHINTITIMSPVHRPFNRNDESCFVFAGKESRVTSTTVFDNPALQIAIDCARLLRDE